MRKSDLARQMMKLAISDSGLTTTEFLERKDELIAEMKPEYFEQLKQRVQSKSAS